MEYFRQYYQWVFDEHSISNSINKFSKKKIDEKDTDGISFHTNELVHPRVIDGKFSSAFKLITVEEKSISLVFKFIDFGGKSKYYKRIIH